MPKNNNYKFDYDISSLNFKDIEDYDFIDNWPININHYLNFCYKFPKILNNFINTYPDSDTRFIFKSIFSTIVDDYSRFACALIDYHTCKSRNIRIKYNKNFSPVMNFITNEIKLPKDIISILPNNIPISHYNKNLKTLTKSYLRKIFVNFYKKNTADIYNSNYLLEYNKSFLSSKLIPFYPERINDQIYFDGDSNIINLSENISKLFYTNLIKILDIESDKAKKIVKLSEIFLIERLNKQSSNLKNIRILLKKEYLSPILLTGTPNVMGRVVSKIYRERNKKVVRYSHGGDRGFFNDPLWFFSELYQADEYYVHGSNEVRNISNRIDKNLIITSNKKPKILSNGSYKHQASFKKNTNIINKVKKIGLVFGMYTNEWAHNTYSHKLPDVITAYYQVQLAKILKEKNFEIIIKPHPKGVLPKLNLTYKLYKKFSNKTITDRFNADNFDVDLMIFDYAGSAWFDALPTNKPIILLDFGVRDFDPSGLDDLKSRCAILDLRFNENILKKIEAKFLLKAIEEAIQKGGCTEEFASKYFY